MYHRYYNFILCGDVTIAKAVIFKDKTVLAIQLGMDKEKTLKRIEKDCPDFLKEYKFNQVIYFKV